MEVAAKARAPCKERLLEIGNECFVRGSNARWPTSSHLVSRARKLYGRLLEIDPGNKAARNNLAFAEEFLEIAPLAEKNCNRNKRYS